MIKRSLFLRRQLLSPEGLPRINNETVDNFAQTGVLRADSAVSNQAAIALKETTARLLIGHLPPVRQQNGDGWVRVDRVTLCHERRNLSEAVSPVLLWAPELAVASRWATTIIRGIGQRMIELGYEEAGDLLAEHKVNRAIAHRCVGAPGDPAVIGEHIDPPAETGVALALALDPGVDALTGSDIAPRTMTIYASSNTCQALGIEQEPHSISSERLRDSLVFTRMSDEGLTPFKLPSLAQLGINR